MRAVNNPLSSMSYTNKDFQTIYPELLEAAKNLAKNWDPTISNESDPGVVLLKLSAIIGDKNNYNIDKNVLENYPETYTQEVSARSQYRQLGYKMPWYRAATVPVTFRWVGEELSLGQYVTIPKHTLLTDSSGEYVFTLLDNVTIFKRDYSTSMTASGKVMQGVINQLSIAGSDVITLSHLDSNNRLYINNSNIAENGIFVYSYGDNDEKLWDQVYNVETESPNSKCYEFDVDQRKNCPYIQFPTDIYSTIGKGLVVKYITTDGYAGNVAANSIDSYLNESTIKIESIDLSMDPTSVPLNTKNIKVFNTYATTETTADVDINMGKDPETIEEARISYKRVAGTFDTLVTLRDYMNAIYMMNPEVASNVVVTDRTNDIQCSYRIVTKYPSVSNTITYNTGKDKYIFTKDVSGEYKKNSDDLFEKGEALTKDGRYRLDISEEKDMTPFDLKLYLLKTSDILPTIDSEKGILKYSGTMDSYDNTFTIDNEDNTRRIIDVNLSESKSIQHDFVDIKPDLPFMLQAVYPIKLKIIPTYKLDDTNQSQVEASIKSTLINLLNSRKCEFGAEPDYNTIYDAIASCDERIKIVIMDDFVYTLFAVYLGYKFDSVNNVWTDKQEFKYVPVSDYSTCDRAIVIHSGAAGSTAEDKIKDVLDEKLQAMKDSDGTSILEDYIFIDAANGIMYTAKVDDNENAALEKYSDRLQELRKQIIAKNVLAGVTPLYDVEDNIFTTTIDMQQVGSESVDKISTNLEIHPFGIGKEYSSNDRKATYTLKDNESIRCLAPSFIMDKSFSSYTKFEMVLESPITSTENYVLADPNDEDNIINRYGYSMFYERGTNGVFTQKSSEAYLKIDATKRFKPDSYYFVRESGSGEEYDIAKVHRTPIEAPYVLSTIVDTNSYFNLEFEKNLYYKKDDEGYKVLNAYPIGDDSDWATDYYSGLYYKLRQVVNSPIYMSISNYCLGMNINDADRLKRVASGRVYRKESGSGDDAYTLTDDYADAIAFLGGESYTGKYTYRVDVSTELSSFDTSVNFKNNFDECYIQLGRYGSDVYKVIKRGNTAVGYEMVMLNESLELMNYDPNAEYIKISYPDAWETDNYRIRYFDNTTAIGGIRSSTIHYIPDVPSETLYVHNEESDSFDEVKSLVRNSWNSEYMNYYVQRVFAGVHPSSNEYLNWIGGRLNLYVPEVTYKLPANTEYQLRKGDSIKFFWREADESDAPYNYEYYAGTDDEYSNPIIKANFAITAKSPSDEKVPSNNMDSSGKIPYDMAPDSPYYQIFYNMAGSEDDLGASRNIEIRRINQVRMKIDGKCENRYYYVVSNNTVTIEDKKYYTLTLDKVRGSTNRYKHILQPDEYFFYVNENRTLYGVLGEGTLIDFTTNNGGADQLVLKSEAVSTTDISFRGIAMFRNQCKEISSSDDIKLIEQQVYSFTKGDTLQFNLKQDYDYRYKKADEDHSQYDSTKTYYSYIIRYKNVELISTGTNTEIVPPFVPNHYYELIEGNYNKIANKPSNWDKVEKGADGQYFYGCTKYYTSDGGSYEEVNDKKADEFGRYYVQITPEYPVISTASPLLLDNVDIYYSTAGTNEESSGKTYTQLPAINVKDDEYKWSVTSYLNLNMSSTSAQKIPIKDDDNQSKCSVTIGKVTYPTDEDTKDLYLMSDVPVGRTGGTNVDVTWINMLGKPNSVNIFSYQLNESADGDHGFERLSDSDVIEYSIEKNKSDKVEIKNIQLDPTKKHILPIELMTDELEITKISVSNTVDGSNYVEASCICCDLNTLNGKGKHFISLSGSVAALKLEYVNHSTTADSAVRFHKMFKYKERELFGGGTAVAPKYDIDTSDIEAEIRLLDIPKEFDYCHIPSESEEILDPLNPISVFSGSHVFNKFTIPKAELRTEEPFSASIDFVNNR